MQCGSGLTCSFWDDVWSDNPHLSFSMPRLYSFGIARCNVGSGLTCSFWMMFGLIIRLSFSMPTLYSFAAYKNSSVHSYMTAPISDNFQPPLSHQV